jgi:hypothetical protein
MPSQSGHAPSGRLKVKIDGDSPVVDAKTSRILSKTFVYVAGFERGLLPIGL